MRQFSLFSTQHPLKRACNEAYPVIVRSCERTVSNVSGWAEAWKAALCEHSAGKLRKHVKDELTTPFALTTWHTRPSLATQNC